MLAPILVLVLAAQAAAAGPPEAAQAPPPAAGITRVEIGEDLDKPGRKLCEYALGKGWRELFLLNLEGAAEGIGLPLRLPSKPGEEAGARAKGPDVPDGARLVVTLDRCETKKVDDREGSPVTPSSVQAVLRARLETHRPGAASPAADILEVPGEASTMARVDRALYNLAFRHALLELAQRVAERAAARLRPPEKEPEKGDTFVPFERRH
jgi:hypothetical protein